MKITSLELENVKRVKAVSLEPAQNGLTVIGGKNGQGKTSVLDAIAWALGGEAYRPSNAQRDGSVLPPRLHVELDNGIVVDRAGKNGSLKVTDPSGRLAGQKLLDEFVEKLALDLPRFMNQSGKEKARTLLRAIGMEEEVKRLDDLEAQLYNRRHALGQIADQKKKYAQELPAFPGVPEAQVSAGELIERQQAILLKNAENQRKRNSVQAFVERDGILKDKKAMDIRDPFAEFMDACYWITPEPEEKTPESFEKALRGGAKFGFKVIAIKQAALSACYRAGLIPNQMGMKSSFYLNAVDSVRHETGEELAVIRTDKPPVFREDMVRIGGINKTADLRYRPAFVDWKIDLVVTLIDTGTFTMESIINAINLGGYMNGIGEWRMERDGDFGRFHVELTEE